MSYLNFTPPASDWTVQLLNNIFGPGWQTFYLNSGVSNATVLDAVMGRFCLLMFSAMCIFFAYTGIVGSYATAHEGKALGSRYHWAYSPIRSVTGFALLAPLGPKGLCALQALVLYFVSMGIGIADDMWGYGLDWIANHNGQITTISSESPQDLAPSLLKSAIMQQVYLQHSDYTGFTAAWKSSTYMMGGLPGDDSLSNPSLAQQASSSATSWVLYFRPDGVQDDPNNPDIPDVANKFGTVTVTCPPKVLNGINNPTTLPVANADGTTTVNTGNAQTQIQNNGADAFCAARKAAVMQTFNDMMAFAKPYVASNEQDNSTGNLAPPPAATSAAALAAITAPTTPAAAPGRTTPPPVLTPSMFASELLSYEQAIGTAVAAYSQSFNSELTSAESEFVNTAKSQGWASAGAWYLQIARINNDVQESIGSGPKAVEPFYPDDSSYEASTLRAAFDHVDDVDAQFTGNSRHLHHSGVIDYTTSDKADANDNSFLEKQIGNKAKSQIVSLYQGVIQHIASGQDPIGQMQTTGHGFLATSAGLVLGGAVASKFSDGVAKAMWTVAQAIGAIGAIMAYAIPLTPFVLWLFAILAWVVMVVECWVAAPVWALAHGLPEGEGFVGQQARQGYMIFFSVLLKPPLLMLGYFLSLAVVSAIMPFVAMMFSIVFAGNSGGDGFFMAILDAIGYTFAFVSVSFIVVRKCFLLITWVPDNLLRWVNVNGGTLGADREVQGGIGGAKAAAGAAGALMGGAGRGAARMIQERGEERENLKRNLTGQVAKAGGKDQLKQPSQQEAYTAIAAAIGNKQLTEEDAQGMLNQDGLSNLDRVMRGESLDDAPPGSFQSPTDDMPPPDDDLPPFNPEGGEGGGGGPPPDVMSDDPKS